MLLVLASLWGASFMFIKIGVRELAPTTLVCVRLGIGALTLLPLALVRLGGRQTVRELRAAAGPLVATGLVNSAVPITTVEWDPPASAPRKMVVPKGLPDGRSRSDGRAGGGVMPPG